MKNEQEKSDLFIGAMKLANKPGRPGAEPVEPRKRTEGNTGEQHTCRTQSRESVSQRLDWVRGAARGASSLITRGGSPVRELRPPGSVRGVPSNGHPYRDRTARGEPGRAATAGQFGDEDHVDLAGLRQCQDLFAFGALLLCPGGDFLPDSDDFVASLLGEGA
jgi:hypothetical protein